MIVGCCFWVTIMEVCWVCDEIPGLFNVLGNSSTFQGLQCPMVNFKDRKNPLGKLQVDLLQSWSVTVVSSDICFKM